MKTTMERDSLFPIFAGLFTATLILSLVTSSGKFVALGVFTFPGGTILFPLTYIFNDIFVETWGFARTRKVIWTGFACLALASAVFWLVGVLPNAGFGNDQETYNKVFRLVPRIALAGMTAYFCGEFVNSVVMSKMKYRHSGQRGVKQAWRYIASTIVGEAVDSAVFMVIAFAGILSAHQMLQTAGSLYLFKVLYEVVATPFSVRFANWIKKFEGVDEIDAPESTSYNPFQLFEHKQRSNNQLP